MRTLRPIKIILSFAAMTAVMACVLTPAASATPAPIDNSHGFPCDSVATFYNNPDEKSSEPFLSAAFHDGAEGWVDVYLDDTGTWAETTQCRPPAEKLVYTEKQAESQVREAGAIAATIGVGVGIVMTIAIGLMSKKMKNRRPKVTSINLA